MTYQSLRERLFTSSMICGAALAVGVSLAPVEAAAQAAGGANGAAQGGPVTTTTGAEPPAGGTVKEVVVTGSLLSRKNYSSDAPLSIVTANDLANRGITTVQSAIQTLATHGAGNLPSSFTGNGAFAAGATGASLRGLTTNSTLVLIDGLRGAYYPLADDGTRNFVDLNTIPEIVVDRVEVLKDGASSTYGADAIAGVINVITKKTFEGLEARAEGGISQHGGGDSSTFQVLAGHGNLANDGFNVWIAAEYEHDYPLYNRQRQYPFNTANLSGWCGPSLAAGQGDVPGSVLNGRTCRQNANINGLQFDGTFLGTTPGAAGGQIGSGTIVPIVAPFDPTNTTQLGVYQLLNPAAGCRGLRPVTLTAANLPAPEQQAALLGSTLCEQDTTYDYRQILPDDKRGSLDFRLTKTIGSESEFYLEGNYYQNDVRSNSYVTLPQIRNIATPGQAGSAYSTIANNIALPIYVCPTGVGCNATNGTLNPNNPFAAAGEVAQIYYGFGDIGPEYAQITSKVYRVASGVHGGFGDGWKYSVDGVFMENDVKVAQYGNIFISHLLNAVNTGSYNFVNPSANSRQELNYIAPPSFQYSTSRLFEITGNISKTLFDLPGGPLQLAIGGSYRFESLNNPSANPDPIGGDPTARYFDINPAGVAPSSRHVESGFFEIDAPLFKPLDIDIGGRYDKYSTGQSHFSPKVGVKYKITDWLTLRGTWSEGFRIPSFAESNSLPTTGFITFTAPGSFLAAHGNNGYGNAYSLGLTTVGTPGLQPETSQNATLGLVWQPKSNLSFSVDYYRIRKDNVIAAADPSAAIAAYYSGGAIPPGFVLTPGAPDPQHPTALPLLQFVQYGFANQNQMFTDGFDYAFTGRFHLGPVAWTTLLDGTYISRLNETLASGRTEHFAGTIGPYIITSASGTPRWRLTWQNTFSYEKTSVTATLYYTSGYAEEGEDVGATRGDCVGSVGTGTPATFADGATPVSCDVRGYLQVDLHGQYQLTPHFQVYGDIQNLFDSEPPLDPTTYGGVNYNPAWTQAGILGRLFKVGVKATF